MNNFERVELHANPVMVMLASNNFIVMRGNNQRIVKQVLSAGPSNDFSVSVNNRLLIAWYQVYQSSAGNYLCSI